VTLKPERKLRLFGWLSAVASSATLRQLRQDSSTATNIGLWWGIPETGARFIFAKKFRCSHRS
jgi:hypothetical protein